MDLRRSREPSAGAIKDQREIAGFFLSDVLSCPELKVYTHTRTSGPASAWLYADS